MIAYDITHEGENSEEDIHCGRTQRTTELDKGQPSISTSRDRKCRGEGCDFEFGHMLLSRGA